MSTFSWLQIISYLVDGIRVVIVNDTQLASFQIKHLDLLEINHISDGQADFDAVAVISSTEYDPLETADPVLGTVWSVCAKVVGTMVRLEGEMQPSFVLVRERSGDTIAKVDLTMWKVRVGRALIV